MRTDLKRPCKNCPFSDTETRIKFACQERAEEIAESAYRFGFPCHLSAEFQEDTEFSEGGYVPGDNTQHCAGAAMMFISDGHDCWPGVDNAEDLVEAWSDRIDWNAPHFGSETEFIDANKGNDHG